jgi:hypothetical protein
VPSVLHSCFSTPVAELEVGQVAPHEIAGVILDAVRRVHARLGTGAGAYEATIEIGSLDGALSDSADVTWTAVLARGDTGATLVLVDPRRIPRAIGGRPLFPASSAVPLRAGLLVVFPGWLQRYATGPVDAVCARIQCFPVVR